MNFKYKAVIFDFDDTLVESRVAKWAQHTHVAKKFYNIDLTERDLLKHWGKPFDTLISELYKNADTLDNMHAVLSSTRNSFPKKLYKESLNVVKKLSENNIKMGIVSALAKKFLLKDLVELGFPVDDFIILQGADETLVHKPNPGVFLPVFERLQEEGIEKRDIVYVGDSLDDLKASTGAGIDFIALTTGLYSQENFEREGAKNIVHDIAAVVNQIVC